MRLTATFKKHLCGIWLYSLQKKDGIYVLVVFSLGKIGFSVQRHPFPRKSLASPQNHLCPRDSLLYFTPTPTFLAKSVHFICRLRALRISVANKVRRVWGFWF